MGAKGWGEDYIEWSVKQKALIWMNTIPDAAMTIATTALLLKETVIRNIYNWRVKKLTD